MEHTKFIYTQQATVVLYYKNIKKKILKLMGQSGLIRRIYVHLFVLLK